MSSYTGTANRPDRAKAIAAVVAVHVALAAIILGVKPGIITDSTEAPVREIFKMKSAPSSPSLSTLGEGWGEESHNAVKSDATTH